MALKPAKLPPPPPLRLAPNELAMPDCRFEPTPPAVADGDVVRMMHTMTRRAGTSTVIPRIQKRKAKGGERRGRGEEGEGCAEVAVW